MEDLSSISKALQEALGAAGELMDTVCCES
jgi:hypothetical protein